LFAKVIPIELTMKTLSAIQRAFSYLSVAGLLSSMTLLAHALPVNTVIATVAIPSGELIGIGVTPNNEYVYVVGYNSNALYVIDAETNALQSDVIGLAGDPYYLAFTPNGESLYVANAVSSDVPGVLSLIGSSSSGSPVLQTTIPGLGELPYAIAINPAGTEGYVTDYDQATISVVDLVTNQVLAKTISVGSLPTGVVFTPNGKHAYVCNAGDNTVDEIDTTTRKMVGKPIPVGTDPRNIVITPNGKKVYTPNGDGTVSVIDTAKNKVTATIEINSNGVPYRLGGALTPDGKYLYVPNGSAGTVVVVSTRTDKIVGTPVTVGNGPGVVAFAPDGQHAYVTNTVDDTVSVIQITGD
jgi:YVTN family beta-propeller protein